MRVLVVEDEARLARQIASALTEAGHDPIIVHDGERALCEATSTPFDLIVLDIILPRMDGFNVLRHLHSQHVASRVLMLTARGEVKDRVTGLRLGADDYLPKPFAMAELVARVNALGRRYAAAGPHFHPHRIVRTGLGARARIRHEAGGSFHRTIAKENRRSTADSYSALRRLHNSRVTIKILGAELEARFGRSAKVTNA